MKKVLAGMVLAAVIVFCAVCVGGAASQDEAKAFSEKAAAYAKANGKEKAAAEFNNPKGQFFKGDLYVFAIDFSGLCLANGGTPQLAGKNLMGLKDARDRFFFKEMVEVAKSKGSGWVEYSWTNPTSKKVSQKVTWVQKVEGTDYFVGCGVYK